MSRFYLKKPKSHIYFSSKIIDSIFKLCSVPKKLFNTITSSVDKLDKHDCVNIFLSEGAGVDAIVSEIELKGQTVNRDAFGHIKLDEINPGAWFAKQFSKKIGAEKTLVQKSGYFARSAKPCKRDLDLIFQSAEMAVDSAINGESGVIGLDEYSDGELKCISFDKIKGGGVIDDSTLQNVMREIRVALLESDVSLSVAKDFIENVKSKAIGQEVIKSISPDQMIIKIVNDQLTALLGSENDSLKLNAKTPVLFLMVGLQGSGKTTTSAKLARWITKNNNKKIMMASLDIYRPAAQEQLIKLGADNDIATLESQENKSPLQIAQIAIESAKKSNFDILILDSAGRNHIDTKMMNEVKEISEKFNFSEILLVSDSMTGQDAVNTAKNFSEQVNLTGIILTRIDGDSRGGAALSMRHVTQKPIKFMGTGEKIDDIEIFHPDRIANRILGMGDVVTLVEKASEEIDEQEAKQMQQKFLKGRFTLLDYSKQLDQLTKMGGIQSVLKYLPGLSGLKEKMEEKMENNDVFKKQKAIINSMTPRERIHPELVKASRKIRISKGSGTNVQDINKLLKQFKKMSQMMKKMGKNKNMDSIMNSGQFGDIQNLINKNKPIQ